MGGFEPPVFPLRRNCFTTKLHRPAFNRFLNSLKHAPFGKVSLLLTHDNMQTSKRFRFRYYIAFKKKSALESALAGKDVTDQRVAGSPSTEAAGIVNCYIQDSWFHLTNWLPIRRHAGRQLEPGPYEVLAYRDRKFAAVTLVT